LGRDNNVTTVRHTAFAFHAVQDDPDLLLNGELPTGLAPDLPDYRFRILALSACHINTPLFYDKLTKTVS